MKERFLSASAALGFLAAGFFSASVARASDGTVTLEGDTSVSAINALNCSAVVLEDGASITNDADLASAVSVACDGAVHLVADTAAGVSPDGGETAGHDISLFDFSLVSGGVHYDYRVGALRATPLFDTFCTRGAGMSDAGVEVDLTDGGSLVLTGGTYYYAADTGINDADTDSAGVSVSVGEGAGIEVVSASGEDPEDRRFNVGNATYTLTDDARIGTARLLATFGTSGECTSTLALTGGAALTVSGRGVVGDSDDADVIFGLAAGTVGYEQWDEATFTATNSEILVGRGGTGEYRLYLNGGTMKVRGIKVSANAGANDEGAIGLFLYGGTLILGSSGIGAYGETGIDVTVDAPTVVGGFAGEVPVTQPVEVTGGGALAFTNALGSAGTGGSVTFGFTGGWACAGSVSVGGDVVLDLSGAEVGEDAGSFVLAAAGAELVLASGVAASVESGVEGREVVSEATGGAVRYALAEGGSGKRGIVIKVR